MKNVIRLLKNVIKNLQKYLSEENNEKDYTTYFIDDQRAMDDRFDDKAIREIIKRRISEIKFDLKTKSLKKVTYDINNENMIFPKINPNIIDNQTNFLIQDNPKENDNSITSIRK